MALFGNLFGKKQGPKEAPASQAGPGRWRPSSPTA